MRRAQERLTPAAEAQPALDRRAHAGRGRRGRRRRAGRARPGVPRPALGALRPLPAERGRRAGARPRGRIPAGGHAQPARRRAARPRGQPRRPRRRHRRRRSRAGPGRDGAPHPGCGEPDRARRWPVCPRARDERARRGHRLRPALGRRRGAAAGRGRPAGAQGGLPQRAGRDRPVRRGRRPDRAMGAGLGPRPRCARRSAHDQPARHRLRHDRRRRGHRARRRRREHAGLLHRGGRLPHAGARARPGPGRARARRGGALRPVGGARLLPRRRPAVDDDRRGHRLRPHRGAGGGGPARDRLPGARARPLCERAPDPGRRPRARDRWQTRSRRPTS